MATSISPAAPTTTPVVDPAANQQLDSAAGQPSSSMTAQDLAALQQQISNNNMAMYQANLQSQQTEMVNATAYNAMSSGISNTGKVMAKTISETNKMLDKATG